MDSNLEQILSKLLIPDNCIILQATNEVREAFKKPEFCTSLVNIICNSQNPQVRQYAVLLLRRKLSKKKHWKKFPDAFRNSIKQMIIERLLAEKEKVVRNSIADLGGTIAKYEIPQGTWPELFNFIMQNIKNSDPNIREFGMLIFSIIVNAACCKMHPHLPLLLNIISSVLDETNNKMIFYYSIKTLTTLVPLILINEMTIFQNLFPKALNVLKAFICGNEDQACEVMEFFDEVIQSEIALIDPFVKQSMELLLDAISSPTSSINIKIKALNILGQLMEFKNKCVIKQKMVEPSLKIIFPVMCTPVDEIKSNEMGDEDEGDSYDLISVAGQVLDMMAIHLPPEKVIPPLLTFIEPAVQSENPYHRKAAYLAIGVIAEGCSEFIRNKYMIPLLQCICKGVNDSNLLVKKSAIFTLEQFAEFLQPDVNKFASELLPPFVNYLLYACRNFRETNKQIGNLVRVFQQFQTFCENLDSVLLPYLPTLMDQLFLMFASAKSSQIKLMLLTAFGSIASAAKEDIMPYVPQIIEIVKMYLTGKEDEESCLLEIQAVDTLSILATVIEPKNFTQLAQECIVYCKRTLSQTSDPDLKRSIYGLLGSISTVLKEDMTQFLSDILPCMIKSLKANYIEHKTPGMSTLPFPIFDLEDTVQEKNLDEIDDDEEEEEEEEEDDDDSSWSFIKTSYVQEKADACKAIQDIAYNVPRGFLPFFQDCAVETHEMIFCREDDIRNAAIRATVQLSFVLLLNFEILKRKEDVYDFLAKLIPELINISQNDFQMHTVITALEGLSSLLTSFAVHLRNRLCVGPMMNMIFKLLTEQGNCQKKCTEEVHDITRTEFDMLLIEHAAGLIPLLAPIVPFEQYYPYFMTFMNLMFPKLERNRTEAERSFAAGTLAECCEKLEGNVKPFSLQLLQAFLNTVHDKDEEVRSNAIYGLGILMEHSKETLFNHYTNVLQVLSTILAKETNNRAKDNIYASVARMIFTNINGVPVDQVFPVLMENLPIKEDLVENVAIFKCIYYMLQNHHPQAYLQLGNIFRVCSFSVAQENFYGAPEQQLVVDVLKHIYKERPEDFQMAMKLLPLELAEKIKLLIM